MKINPIANIPLDIKEMAMDSFICLPFMPRLDLKFSALIDIKMAPEITTKVDIIKIAR